MKRALGFFYAVTLTLLVFFTIYIQQWNPLERSIPVLVHFPTVEGLQKGDDVRIEGKVLGKVASIDLEDQGGVLVRLNLDSRITLYEGYKIYVEAFTVLGGNFVSISRGPRVPGKEMRIDDPGVSLKGEAKPSAFDQFAELVMQNRDSLNAALTNLGDAMGEFRQIGRSINESKGTAGLLVNDRKLYDEATGAVTGIRETFADIRGSVADIRGAVTEARTALGTLNEALQRKDSTVGKLLHSSELHDRTTEMLDAIRKAAESAVEEVRSVTRQIREGEGPVAALLNDKQMKEDLKTTASNLRKVSQDVEKVTDKLAKGEGTLGKLVHDEKVYHTLQETLEGVDKTIGRAGRSHVHVASEFKSYADSELGIGKIGLRLSPDESKYFYGGGAFLSLSANGPLRFTELLDTGKDETVVKPELYVCYRIPWFFDNHVGVKAGLLEGKPGGGVEIDFDLFENYPVHFELEARDAYNDVGSEDIDEEIAGPMTRVWGKVPLWKRGGTTWYEQILHALKLYGGVSRLQDEPEYMIGLGLEYRDEDIKSLVGLAGLGR